MLTQSSDEECDAIVRIVEELLGRRVVDDKGPRCRKLVLAGLR
jgi:hypothetical protein